MVALLTLNRFGTYDPKQQRILREEHGFNRVKVNYICDVAANALEAYTGAQSPFYEASVGKKILAPVSAKCSIGGPLITIRRRA